MWQQISAYSGPKASARLRRDHGKRRRNDAAGIGVTDLFDFLSLHTGDIPPGSYIQVRFARSSTSPSTVRLVFVFAPQGCLPL